MFNLLFDYFKKHRNPIKYWRDKGAKIGEDCEIYSTASFGSEPYLVEVGNHVRINSGVIFVTHDGGVWVLREYLDTPKHKDIDLIGKIKVGNNVHIGTNTIIMPNVNIGDNCIIGCGAIVTKNVSSGSVVAGVPARTIETLDEYISKNKDNFDYTKNMKPLEKKLFLTNKYN